MMTDYRQKIFLKLKPPCVNLSAVALKFRAGEAPVKDVLKALETVKKVLDDIGPAGSLDPKLAEYAFFPLAQQVFNETRRLSPRCLEVAAQCVTVLVKYGYRQALIPELGKQLLILMSMLAGAGPTREDEKIEDELKIAAFDCMLTVIEALKASTGGATILEDQGTKNVVDQLVYLLLDAITNSSSDQVQLSASNVLTVLVKAIESRVFLASLLPRTVSALTKALQLSTKARRTQKVLAADLKALRNILSRTLADRMALDPTSVEEREVLDKSWLNTTAGQVKNALQQVIRLRTQDSISIQSELEQLCVMVIEECHVTLAESIPAMLETLVAISAQENGERAQSITQHLVTVYPDMAELLRTKFYDMYQALPVVMQGHDEQVKQRALQRLTASLKLLPAQSLEFDIGESDFVPVLVNSVSDTLRATSNVPIEIHDTPSSVSSIDTSVSRKSLHFQAFLLNREGQKGTFHQLQALLTQLSQIHTQPAILRRLIDEVADSDGSTRLAAAWLALRLLDDTDINLLDTNEWISVSEQDDQLLDKSSLIADLHANTLPLLANVFEEDPEDESLWQMQALAMECVVKYAQTFPGDSYRPELMNSLYPVLSFLGSPNAILRSHSINALNMLAQTCQYASAKDLLIDNVDYLVNSIAWKLNTYSLSPEAPQILQMMVKLCGAQLIPYLDDLIQSIFAALDSYHGYPQWVEALFSTLKAMVDEGKRQPQLAITEGKSLVSHRNLALVSSSRSDILDDLRSRKRRKLDFERPADEPPSKAPHRPWTSELDGPTFPRPQEPENPDGDENGDNENEHLAPTKQPEPQDEEKKLSKTHELLLSIAKSTLPHLASPSPQVRHLLLDLLKDISPLLSRDETSFLPLINAIWPVLVPRLFAEQVPHNVYNTDSVNGGDTPEETGYNICAAADTIAVLCEGGGDFMASRIEDISAQLLRLVQSTQAQVPQTNDNDNAIPTPYQTSLGANLGQNITGSVSLDIVRPEVLSTSTGDLDDSGSNGLNGSSLAAAVTTSHTSKPSKGASTSVSKKDQELRTSQRQILYALLRLLAIILSHVSLTLDTGDEIMRVLLPYLDHQDLDINVREVLEGYNADAVWLFELLQRRKVTKQKTSEAVAESPSLSKKRGMVIEVAEESDENTYDNTISPPKLRKELLDMGIRLQSLAV